MLGAPATNAAKKVRLTVKIPEEKQECIICLLSLQECCEVVSNRRVQSGNGQKCFTVPRDDDTSAPPTPVRIFLARYKVVSPADVQQPVVSDDVVEGDKNISVSTCDFCLRSSCIMQSGIQTDRSW
ncbi:unnamed protein product [Porites evermanni]|uniref:Uncharacterized protein n=1 Tax=Porites evermanni TaxID=104178 RepID=A0ABN8S4E7_9CNID|nr:unnamed protein product [Porites evermanni]